MTKASFLPNYAGFALSCHLAGDRTEALEAINSLLELAAQDKTFEPLDWTNVLIYKAQLLRETSNWNGLLELVEANESKMLGSSFKLEQKALALIELGQHEKAREVAEKLLSLRPDNEAYITLWVRANPSQSKGEVLVGLRDRHKTRILDFLILRETADLDLFRQILKGEVEDNARRFIPSFFKSLREVCRNDQKRQAVLEVLTEGLENFRKTGRVFPTLNGKETSPNDPTAELFLLYSLAGFHCYDRNLEKAYALVKEAQAHTPTFEDAQVLESLILKKHGNPVEAAARAGEWHKLAFGDKGLNSQAVRFHLKANLNREADLLFKRFMREDKLVEKQVHELQMMNHEMALATSYAQELRWPHALALLQIVEKNVDEIFEDQYDFYSFCFRKYTLVPLYEAIRFNDVTFKEGKLHLRFSHKFYKALALYQDAREVYAVEAAKAKEGKSEEEAKEWETQRTLSLKENTIEAPEELVTAIDLEGTKFVSTVDFDKKRAEVALKLRFVEHSQVKAELKAKVYQMLFWHAIHTKNAPEALDYFQKAVSGPVQPYDVLLFGAKLRKLAEGDAAIAGQIAPIEAKAAHAFKDDSDFKELLAVIGGSIGKGDSVVQRSALVGEYLRKHLAAGFEEWSFAKKRAVVKVAKDYCHERETILGAWKAKKQNKLPK